MDAFDIRPFSAEDRAAWEPLWQGYLDFYERHGFAREITDATWRRLLTPGANVRGLGCFSHGALLGIAHYVFQEVTSWAAPRCYLNDLFTAPEARGRGVGRALIEAVASAARAEGADQLWWLTHETNTQARALYDGVAERSGFIQYRMPLA